MCGLTGFAAASASTADDLTGILRPMCEAIAHRGPDDSGEWIDSGTGVALGFRRLAIIDVSPAGHQPMVSASGRYVVTFNGEIYNFEALRQELREAGLAPAPYSIYEGIRKLMPGMILTFDPATREVETTTYWSPARSSPVASIPHCGCVLPMQVQRLNTYKTSQEIPCIRTER
jgi:hypothetical protein